MLSELNFMQFYKGLPQYRRRDRYEDSLKLIQELIDCDDFEDIATFKVVLHVFSAFKC